MNMDLIFVISVILQITETFSKRDSSSDESIDNILYYKDCNHEKEKEPIRLRAEAPPPPPRQPECIPRMCCSMSCNNNCGGDQPVMTSNTRQRPLFMSPVQEPQPPAPLFTQLPVQRAKLRKKKTAQPVNGRRSLGFTREHIKHLISQDEDIKKILKDLVRVTMQKVDLIEMVNERRNAKITETDRGDRDTSNNDDNVSNGGDVLE